MEAGNGGKFGAIFLQEMWPGDCSSSVDTDPTRLCGDASEKATIEHSIVKILGNYGERYRYQCSEKANGSYDCIAVDPALFEVVAGTKGYLTGNCGKGDTGFFTHQFKFTPTQTYVSMVSTHMIGIPSTDCRKSQMQQLYNTYIDSNKQIIIAGDFNTYPWRANQSEANYANPYEMTTAADYYRSIFLSWGFWRVISPSWLAYELSDQNTADYDGVSIPLDHVLSNFLYFPTTDKHCPVGDLGFFGGTDHKYTLCRVTGLYGGGVKTQ